MSDAPVIEVNGQRLWDSLMELAKIGAYFDEEAQLTGVNRQALTDADSQGRHLVVSWMREAGLDVRVDAMGNVYGRRPGTDPRAEPVLAGSHIDSVGTAGAFDGCLGVLGAIEVVRTLNEAGIKTRRPIDVCFFTDEEGVRFGASMLGSAVAAGRIDPQAAYDRADVDGVTLGAELERTGWKGSEPARLDPPHAYVECHIEQGPILAKEGFTVGVVEGVQGISWYEVVVHGKAAHSGTTPTQLRVDAGLGAARIVCHLREMVDSGNFGRLRAAAGRIVASPGLPNVVPARVDMTVDLRNPHEDALADAERELTRFFTELESATAGLRIEYHRMARTKPVPFDEGVQKAIAGSIEDLGMEHMALMSGAGHDAQEIAAIAPAAMIFVRGEYDGISHNPREYSTPESCTAGINVLATTILRLANE